MFYDFPYIGNVITPTDELHHFSEGQVNHQPDHMTEDGSEFEGSNDVFLWIQALCMDDLGVQPPAIRGIIFRQVCMMQVIFSSQVYIKEARKGQTLGGALVFRSGIQGVLTASVEVVLGHQPNRTAIYHPHLSLSIHMYPHSTHKYCVYIYTHI